MYHIKLVSILNFLVLNMLLITLASGTSLELYEVVHGWPRLPENDALGQVTGVDVDSRNRVIISHRGANPVRAFDADTGEQAAAWGEGLFGSPHGLEVDHDDNIWVTDPQNQQVYKFSSDGKLLMTVGAKEVKGTDQDHFNSPTGVAVLPNGEFYVADGYGNSRVVKFDKHGKYLYEWGRKGDKPGEFNTVHGIAADKKGRVYVADRSNTRIQVFDGRGNFLQEWKSEEIGRPWGLTVGSDGYLYVVDGGDVKEEPPERNAAIKMDLDGKIIAKWGRFGSYDGQFYWAHDIAVGPDGAVYVVDVHLGMRVQKFVPKH